MTRTMKTVFLLLALLVAAEGATTCINTDSCVLSCAGCTDGELVPDPDDCHSFYLCQSDKPDPDLPFSCGDGEHFDAATHKCVDGDDCEDCPATDQCYYECAVGPYKLSVHSYQYNCMTYYDCDAERTESCPTTDPFFDGTSCQSDERKCCSCKPYCSTNQIGSSVIDPVDCTKYWLCTDVGNPTYSNSCPDGENFDELYQDCSEFYDCATNSGCYNVVDSEYCIDIFTCESTGLSPKCLYQCVSEYYYCTQADIGNRIEPQSCSNGLVFHPDNHMCISSSECPYSYNFHPSVIRH